jgi:hypothetical protein
VLLQRSLSTLILLFAVAVSCPAQQSPAAQSSQYAIGADISFLPQAEQQGAIFK